MGGRCGFTCFSPPKTKHEVTKNAFILVNSDIKCDIKYAQLSPLGKNLAN